MILSELPKSPPAAKQLIRTAIMLVILLALLLSPLRINQQQGLIISVSTFLLIVALLTTLSVRIWTKLRSLIPGNKTGRIAAYPGDRIFWLVAIVRRAGLSSLGLLFFVFWALLYMLIWSLSSCPECAFYGAGQEIAISEFFYLSVNLAVANPPPTIYPLSIVSKAFSS